MAAQVAAVELLMTKADFDPKVALAVTEAFSRMLTEAQVATAPMLDARMSDLEPRFSSLDHKIDLAEKKLEARIDGVEKRLESQILVSEARLEKLIVSSIASLKTEMMSMKAELMRWVLLTMLGAVSMQAGVTAVVNMLR